MSYPYFDVLFNMAKALAGDNDKLRLLSYRDRIYITRYGPTCKSQTLYITPEGDDLIGGKPDA